MLGSAMSEYHLVGEPIDSENRPAVFELKLCEHLPDVNPKTFGLSDVPAIDPHAYFITSGDALAKAIKLEKDMWKLAALLNTTYAKLRTIKGKKTWIFESKYKKHAKKYAETVWKCAGRCRAMKNNLNKAKGVNCFLETEWREQRIIVIPKNPRIKSNIIHAKQKNANSATM